MSDKKGEEPAQVPDMNSTRRREERKRRRRETDTQTHIEKLKQLVPTSPSTSEIPDLPMGTWEDLAREVFGTPDLSSLPVEEAWQTWVQQKKIARIVDEAKWIQATNELHEEYMQYARKSYAKHRYYDSETVLHHIREGKRFLFDPRLVIGPKGVVWPEGGILWADVVIMESVCVPYVWYSGRYFTVEHVEHKWGLLFRLWDGSSRKIELNHTSNEEPEEMHPHDFIFLVADEMYRYWCRKKILEDFKMEARPQQARVQQTPIQCVLCDGTGHCFYCGGTGTVPATQTGCENCGGTGRCTMCSGKGKC